MSLFQCIKKSKYKPSLTLLIVLIPNIIYLFIYLDLKPFSIFLLALLNFSSSTSFIFAGFKPTVLLSHWYLSLTIFTTNPLRNFTPQAHHKNTLTLHLLFSRLRDKMTFWKERIFFSFLRTCLLTICIIFVSKQRLFITIYCLLSFPTLLSPHLRQRQTFLIDIQAASETFSIFIAVKYTWYSVFLFRVLTRCWICYLLDFCSSCPHNLL